MSITFKPFRITSSIQIDNVKVSIINFNTEIHSFALDQDYANLKKRIEFAASSLIDILKSMQDPNSMIPEVSTNTVLDVLPTLESHFIAEIQDYVLGKCHYFPSCIRYNHHLEYCEETGNYRIVFQFNILNMERTIKVYKTNSTSLDGLSNKTLLSSYYNELCGLSRDENPKKYIDQYYSGEVEFLDGSSATVTSANFNLDGDQLLLRVKFKDDD